VTEWDDNVTQGDNYLRLESGTTLNSKFKTIVLTVSGVGIKKLGC